MKKETIRAIVDIIVAENKEIIVLKEEYWNEVIDSKWLESRHKDRYNEIDYRVVHNKLFLYALEQESSLPILMKLELSVTSSNLSTPGSSSPSRIPRRISIVFLAPSR